MTPTGTEPFDLWLDDVRDPVQHGALGYVWVRTVPEAQAALETGLVRRASLDHDLGLCDACWAGAKAAAQDGDGAALLDLKNRLAWNHGLASYASCKHHGTGYDLCLWMARTGRWPQERPVVHSANPVGRDAMRGVIARYFGLPAQEA